MSTDADTPDNASVGAAEERAACLVSVALGLMSRIPGVLAIDHFAPTGEVWTFMGPPTYGNGPFDRIGLPTSTALLAGFLAVCITEVADGLIVIA